VRPPAPEFSVIVPTFKRPRALGRLLAALSNLDYPRDRFEVIVVDDGSGDDVNPIVERFRGELDVAIMLQENTGPAGARNRGAAHAQGRYLAFIDDDCKPVPGWLKAYHNALESAPEAACGGPTENVLRMNLFSAATQKLADFLHGRNYPTAPNGAFFAANNLCVPRSGFLDAGGFDATMRFGEDREFCHRWTSLGKEFRYAPEARVGHSHQLGLWSFLRLHFRYGHGSGVFRRICAAKGLPQARFNGLSWYWKLVGAGQREDSGGRGLLLCGLLALSQVATAAGMAWSGLECWLGNGAAALRREQGCRVEKTPGALRRTPR
jgi:glycosyltransferase involved in cell wall biosynthesis